MNTDLEPLLTYVGISREHLEAALALPLPPSRDDLGVIDYFDPWRNIIHGIYGSYSNESDDLMIEVLEAVRDQRTFEIIQDKGFAAELILYLLAGHGLTSYGTSPRGGWAEFEIEDLWQPLIDKWKAYRDIAWSQGMPS